MTAAPPGNQKWCGWDPAIAVKTPDEDATDVTDEVPFNTLHSIICSGGDNPLTKLVNSESKMLLFLWLDT